MLDITLLWLLTVNEARGEPSKCYQHIADVVVSRMQDTRWPDSLQAVLSQDTQFPWWNSRWEFEGTLSKSELCRTGQFAVDYTPQKTKARFFLNPEKTKWRPTTRLLFSCGNHNFYAAE